jgi:hypothetical protein
MPRESGASSIPENLPIDHSGILDRPLSRTMTVGVEARPWITAGLQMPIRLPLIFRTR